MNINARTTTQRQRGADLISHYRAPNRLRGVPKMSKAAVVVHGGLAGSADQNASSDRSISDRSTVSAMARSAETFGSTLAAKNCAAATLPS